MNFVQNFVLIPELKGIEPLSVFEVSLCVFICLWSNGCEKEGPPVKPHLHIQIYYSHSHQYIFYISAFIFSLFDISKKYDAFIMQILGAMGLTSDLTLEPIDACLAGWLNCFASLYNKLGKPQKKILSGRATKRGGQTGVPLRQKELFLM